MDWKEKLFHYQHNAIDDIPDEDLLDEAIATCENYFSIMSEDELLNDKLLHHNRPLAIAYLALKYQKTKKEQGD